MAWRRVLGLAAVCLCLMLGCARAEGVNRALLIGCDNFVTQPSTAPSSENNVAQMANALSGGAMNLDTLVTRRNDVVSADEVEALVLSTFGAADAGDVSYFYISTHGEWNQGQPNGSMTLLLSDGETENGLTADRLRAIFDQIKGTKVLILDACHAGAVIGKGVHAPFTNVFAGADYKVLCSSGGAEESWFWSGNELDASTGAGFFSGAVAAGLSAQGGFGADTNRDGIITLTELKQYLMANHGASTPQSYPETDDFPILTYDAASYTGRRRDSVMEGITFVDGMLSATDPSITFSFTMLRPAQVAYQLVYQRSGRWDFDNSQLIWDDAERFGAYGDAHGWLTPGMKERTLSLSREDTGSYGYVLVQMLTIVEGEPALASSRVLCVPPATGDPLLEILTEESFCPEKYQEINFVVHHQYPCELTAVIEDMSGNVVRRLASRTPSRPEQLLPRGSTFCWDGRRSDGTLADEGMYRLRIKAYIGDAVYECLSEPIVLLSSQG